MLQSYFSRENTNSQTSSRKVHSGKNPNEESPVSQESSILNEKLLQCLVNQVQSYSCLWGKAYTEYKLGHKKKFAWIIIASIIGIGDKSIGKSGGCL